MKTCALIVALASCTTYTPPNASDAAIDAPAACTSLGVTCGGPAELRDCSRLGEPPSITACNWGCIAGSPAHCGDLVPSGGGVDSSDFDSTGLSDVTLTGGLDGASGAISGPNRGAGVGILQGIDFQIRNSIGVFRFKSLHVGGTVALGGDSPIALVADGPIVIDGVLEARGTCATNTHGPGGFNGGLTGASGLGSGAGEGSTVNQVGGGGGGGGAPGGNAGANLAGVDGGAAFGDAAITVLRGGGGGGGGSGGGGGVGGGGGGAIQLVSNTSITIGNNGGINAGGCGGKSGGVGGNDSGGGGGAGGTILLEAPMITVAGVLAVNGGSGGNSGASGGDGTLGRTVASTIGGSGAAGFGGAGNSVAGGTGTGQGGGGGAVGRIRFDVRAGTTVVVGGVLSPALDDNPTATTQGDANVK